MRKNRLEIIKEVYGDCEWSSSALMHIARCMELAQEQTQMIIEQAITDPENQPSQYGTVLMKEWVGLTDEEIWETERIATISYQRHKYGIGGQQVTPADNSQWHYARAIEAKLKEKNT